MEKEKNSPPSLVLEHHDVFAYSVPMDETGRRNDAIDMAHDAFVKRVLGNPEHARDFLRLHLPPDIVAHLDMATLRTAKESFVGKNLRQYFSDLVFHLQGVDGQPVGVYLLLEHKSAPYPHVNLQILRYMTSLWRRHLDRKKKPDLLPVVVPLVLYHGNQRWQPKPLAELIALPAESFRVYVPQWRTELCDVQRLDLDRLHHHVVVQAALLMLRHIFDPRMKGKLAQVFDLLYKLEQTDSRMEYLEVFLRYAVACADLDEEDISAALKNMPVSIKEENMPTLAQKWMEQGRQEGLKEGQQDGWQKGQQDGQQKTIRETITRLDSLGLDIGIICQAVDLPRSEVEKVLRAQHTGESH